MNTIALSKINLKAPTQLWSSGEDMSHVEDLAHSFADTGSFKELPWVALIKDTNEYVPIDGAKAVLDGNQITLPMSLLVQDPSSI